MCRPKGSKPLIVAGHVGGIRGWSRPWTDKVFDPVRAIAGRMQHAQHNSSTVNLAFINEILQDALDRRA